MIGLQHTSQLTVTEAVTAITMGSGDIAATPSHSLPKVWQRQSTNLFRLRHSETWRKTRLSYGMEASVIT